MNAKAREKRQAPNALFLRKNAEIARYTESKPSFRVILSQFTKSRVHFGTRECHHMAHLHEQFMNPLCLHAGRTKLALLS